MKNMIWYVFALHVTFHKGNQCLEQSKLTESYVYSWGIKYFLYLKPFFLSPLKLLIKIRESVF